MSSPMPGMHTGLNSRNPIVVDAFKSLLLHQLVVLLIILGVVWIGATSLWLPTERDEPAGDGVGDASPSIAAVPEAAARRLLRIGFGLLWVLDGLLQLQTAMPLGMPSQVIDPAADGSPSWVRHLASVGASIWSDHPVTAAASAVWIQLGIGAWLLVAPRGRASRLGGLASAAWGILVWIFGEAFGGMFAPGWSVLFGAPGAVLFYVLAGAAIAGPERWWSSPRLPRAMLAVVGGFLVAMAVGQAWPGRGFWQGRLPGRPASGPVAAMARDMATTPQPGVVSGWLRGFGGFDAAHGWAVNLFVVITLASAGLLLLSGRPRLVRVGAAASVVFCLADWLLVQDLGVFGGVGTDPNSMVPLPLLTVSAWLALTRAPVPVRAEAEPATGRVLRERASAWRGRVRTDAGYAARLLAALSAAAITLVGAAPMASASVQSRTDPILARAIAGPLTPANLPLPNFRLVDQRGRVVTPATLRGKVVLLTLLDPVCTSDCPEIAQELREADSMLGPSRSGVDIVAIVANPIDRSIAFTRAFTTREYLGGLPNWRYLTGSLAQLRLVWKTLGNPVQTLPAGAMVAHADTAYFVDRSGRIREYLDSDPGPGTAATKSSFAVLLAHATQALLRRS